MQIFDTVKHMRGDPKGLGLLSLIVLMPLVLADCGALVGAGGGAYAGNQFGKGSGKTAATIGGAVGGAIIGNEVEKHL
jgi:hypothetical protein